MKTVFACLAPILLITDFALGQSVPTSLTNGLVAYYGFNGNLNDSAGSNNLQNFGTTFANDRFGNPSNALSVAPTTYLVSQFNIGISGNSERTVSLWLNVASNPIFPNGRLVTWGDNTPSQAFWFVYSGNTPGGLAADYSFQNNNVDPPSLAGSWQHVVYTYSGTLESVRFYINGGTDVNDLLGTNFINTLNTPLYVNADNPANPMNLGMDGLMSDLGLWSRALSSNEVTTLYQAQSVPEPSTYALLLLSGAASLWALKRRKR